MPHRVPMYREVTGKGIAASAEYAGAAHARSTLGSPPSRLMEQPLLGQVTRLPNPVLRIDQIILCDVVGRDNLDNPLGRQSRQLGKGHDACSLEPCGKYRPNPSNLFELILPSWG